MRISFSFSDNHNFSFIFCLILQTSSSTRLSLSTTGAKKLPLSENATKLGENLRDRESPSTPFGILNRRSRICVKSHNEHRNRRHQRSKRSTPPRNDHLPSLSPLSAMKSNAKVAKVPAMSKSSKLQSKKPKRINKKSMFGIAYLCNKVYFLNDYITAFRICKSYFKKQCFWIKNHRKTQKNSYFSNTLEFLIDTFKFQLSHL